MPTLILVRTSSPVLACVKACHPGPHKECAHQDVRALDQSLVISKISIWVSKETNSVQSALRPQWMQSALHPQWMRMITGVSPTTNLTCRCLHNVSYPLTPHFPTEMYKGPQKKVTRMRAAFSSGVIFLIRIARFRNGF